MVVNPVKTYKEEKVITYKDVIKYHKVKNGDNLSEIASKYNVSLTEIKKWNNLSGTNIGVGKSLKIIKNEKVVTTIRKEIKVDKKATETLVANKEEKENNILQKNNLYYDNEHIYLSIIIQVNKLESDEYIKLNL